MKCKDNGNKRKKKTRQNDEKGKGIKGRIQNLEKRKGEKEKTESRRRSGFKVKERNR
jgi:hypothetical protein